VVFTAAVDLHQNFSSGALSSPRRDRIGERLPPTSDVRCLARRNPLVTSVVVSVVISVVISVVMWSAVIFDLVSDTTMQVFRETGAYLNGHFRLTSGLHSNEYLQCALVLAQPAIAERLGRELAGKLEMPGKAEIVVSPAVGGLIIGHEVARALGARFIFAERDSSGKMTLRRGFSVRSRETAVVIEDVVTTGGSTREVIELLQSAGVRVLGAGSIIDRSGGRVDLGVPRVALATLDVTSWTAEECPLCRQGMAIEKPGSRPA
jgi:orotate phosphoribosyltransferase